MIPYYLAYNGGTNIRHYEAWTVILSEICENEGVPGVKIKVVKLNPGFGLKWPSDLPREFTDRIEQNTYYSDRWVR